MTVFKTKKKYCYSSDIAKKENQEINLKICIKIMLSIYFGCSETCLSPCTFHHLTLLEGVRGGGVNGTSRWLNSIGFKVVLNLKMEK